VLSSNYLVREELQKRPAGHTAGLFLALEQIKERGSR